MREIKFRAWEKTSESMVYDVQNVSGKRIIGESACESFQEVLDSWEYETMQYTGLKDKNGVEIYEGDVLEAEHKLKTQKFKRKYQVIFNEKGYWDAISLDDKPVRLCYAGFDKCEVIGNIYENPELLGGEE